MSKSVPNGNVVTLISNVSRIAVRTVPLVCGLSLAGAPVDESKLPPTAPATINFDRDIKPIFEHACFRCHGPEKPKSGFRLDNREAALKGGNNYSDDIVPGQSAKSRLIHNVAQLAADMEMPPSGKGDPLTPEQVGLLRAWIDQGANWGDVQFPPALAFSASPTLRWIGVQGNAHTFREVEGMKEGWAGGAQEFNLRERLGEGEFLSAEGRALFGDEDYRVKLALDKRDVGFVRGGFETWRKYYDDTGGYAPLLPTNSFNLGRDPHVDTGRAWVDFGLMLPDRPQLVLGYEYQFKQGEKSTLQWGPVLGPSGVYFPNDPTDARNIYPASKHIDEHTHLVKFDASHEWRGWQLKDHAQIEFYRLETSRQDLLAFPTSDAVSRVDERHDHVQGVNTFSVHKQFKDWFSVSGGYLYSRLEGDAALNQSTLDGTGAFTGGDQWHADHLALERESHVASLGSLAGPWAGLSFTMGLQAEWTRQENVGFENLRLGNPSTPPLFDQPSTILGKLDSAIARENLGLRFTRLPFTVLFAEARLRQERLSRFEQRPEGSEPFTRDTDADLEAQEYRAGFSTSPWQRWSCGASFKRTDRRTDYRHAELFNPSGHVYPGFLLWREIEGDQVEARLVFRAAPWLKTALTYKWQETDYNSATPIISGLIPAGTIDAAHYAAHVYSLNATLTPFRRWYFSGTISYSDSRTTTAQHDADYLAPFKGDIYSVLASATFLVNTNTDLNSSYAYSRSNFGQDNLAGLPAGIDFERHALRAGFTRRLTGNVTASLAYGFYQYHEPSSGGANNYTAHGVFAALAFKWQ